MWNNHWCEHYVRWGDAGYFRDPWLALNFLREMWLLLFNPRDQWFDLYASYRDPWFHKYFPRYPWKRPHFHRENDEKFWKISVLLNDFQRKIGSDENCYAAMEYVRYKCWCTLHTYETLLVGNSENILVGLRCRHNPQKGGLRNVHSPKKCGLGNLSCKKRGYIRNWSCIKGGSWELICHLSLRLLVNMIGRQKRMVLGTGTTRKGGS